MGVIDLAESSKEKMIERGPHVTLEACNARPDCRDDSVMSLTLPCRVVVRSFGDDHVKVDLMDPGVIIDLVGDKMHDMAAEVRNRFEMVRDALAPAPAIVSPA